MISAVIFDLDGTIVDSEPVWEEVFQMVKMRHSDTEIRDFPLSNGWMHEPAIGVSANWRKLVLDRDKAEEFSKETNLEYKKLVEEEEEVQVKVGAVEAIEKAQERGWLTALATGSLWTVVEKQLEELGLHLAFNVTTTGEEVLMNKPDPEIYTLTSQKMGVEPEECVVIEDAVAGVRAAKEAGMKVIALVSEYAPAELLQAAGADWVVEDWEEVTKIFSELDQEKSHSDENSDLLE